MKKIKTELDFVFVFYLFFFFSFFAADVVAAAVDVVPVFTFQHIKI